MECREKKFIKPTCRQNIHNKRQKTPINPHVLIWKVNNQGGWMDGQTDGQMDGHTHTLDALAVVY